jgi:hypothetical protein
MSSPIPTAEEDMQKFNHRFNESIISSFADGNTFQLVNFFSEDAILFGWSGNASGHREIVEHYAAGVRRVRDEVPGLKKIDIETTQIDSHVSDDLKYGCVFGVQKVAYRGAAETVSITSRFTYALYRDDAYHGEWKIKHLHSSQERGFKSLPEAADVTFNV